VSLCFLETGLVCCLLLPILLLSPAHCFILRPRPTYKGSYIVYIFIVQTGTLRLPRVRGIYSRWWQGDRGRRLEKTV